MPKIELTSLQMFAMKIKGFIYVSHRTSPDWNGSVPFYAFDCPVHGIVENHPQVNKSHLECPKCGHKVKVKRGGD